MSFRELMTRHERNESGKASGTREEHLSMNSAMAAHIRNALIRAGGKINGPGGAAELLNVNPSTLRNRMGRLGIGFGRKSKTAL